MFKEANKTFLVVGFFIILFLLWLIFSQFNNSSPVEVDEDDWLKDLGLSVNIWPEGEPLRSDWEEILNDCLPKSDNLSQARCSYILEEINSFDDCLVAGFSASGSDPEQCQTSDGQLFINQ